MDLAVAARQHTSSLSAERGAHRSDDADGGNEQAAAAAAGCSGRGMAPMHLSRQHAAAQQIGAWRATQLCIVYVAVAAHVLVMAYTDPLQEPSAVLLLLLFSVQLSLLLAILLAFFLLTSHSPDVALGIYHRYLRRHRGFYITAAAALALFSAASGYRLAMARDSTPQQLAWRARGFLPLWALSRTALLAFHCAAARGAALSLRPPSEPWLAAAAAAGVARF